MADPVIGIDVGGTMIKAGLFDGSGTLLKKDELPTGAGPDELCENIAALAGRLQTDTTGATAVGIGIAGLLDAGRHVLIESPNLPRLRQLPLRETLQQKLSLPVHLENDANAAALGELWAGQGRGLDNFLLLTLGTGIGSGLILNGRLWTGELGKAGEFGHTVVDPAGPQCACGRRGCVEACASGSALVRMAREAIARGDDTTLAGTPPEELTPKAIYTAAHNGDAVARELFQIAARHLATAIANVNNLLDIHTFIIGGGVSKAASIFQAGLLEHIRHNVFAASRDKIRVVISELGNDAGIFGAAFLALQPGSAADITPRPG